MPNRRTFLLGLGLSACRPTTQPLEAPPPRKRSPPEEGPTIIDVDLAMTASNVDRSPLVVEGDTLVQGVGRDQLWQWDLATMKRVDAFSLDHDGFTWLDDGSLAVWGARESECVVYRLVKGALRTNRTLCGLDTGRLMRGPNGTVYSVRQDEVMQLRFGATELEEVASIELPKIAARRDQMYSLADGRIVALGDGLVILAPGQPAKSSRMPAYARHLAPATGEQFWYTHGTGARAAIDTLVLAALADPTRDVRVIRAAPWRIVHAASYGSGIALLLAGPVGPKWFVAVVDENGTERWRAEVTDLAQHPYELNFHGAVALSEKRLVLHRQDHVLLAWDAKTGAAIEVERPGPP